MLSFFVMSLGIRSYAAGYNWYIKRNGLGTPTFPENANLISEYDCYYIDKRAATSGEKVLYLTFDAGYENGNVEKIVDVLDKYDISAAFFVLDNLIYKNPNLIKRLASEGHLVCNHTKNHKDLSAATVETIQNDLKALEDICKSETGVEMAKYFRFPCGRYSPEAIKTVSELGYKTVFWSFAYEDWDNKKQPSEEYAIKKILNNTHDGAIILLHPTSQTNARIMERLVLAWREMGYSFGTLDELTSRNAD
ncbi:MAG: polysaccharide deacetylase family protein [Clostridia bacterium]|nr:polysaccharide deacetylase family protein [Clostridia bacterium]